MKLNRFPNLILFLLACTTTSAAVVADEGTNVEADHKYQWDRPRNGWRVGARLLGADNQLNPGDPAVFQFVLRNTTSEERTVVIQQYDNTHPTLGVDNRIALNILGSSQRKHQHKIGAGETLELRQYRVTVSTEGLPPGRYHADAQPAFWMSEKDKPNRGTGIGRGFAIPFIIGNPSDTKLSKIPSADDEQEHIYWGKPVAGLVVGMRTKGGRREWDGDSRIESEMFVRNLSQSPIEFEFDVPAPGDWNMRVLTQDGSSVRLDTVWYSGLRARVTRTLTLRPFEQAPMLADDKVAVGPVIQVLRKKTEFQPGSPPRLITSGGDYQWEGHVTVRQSRVKDLTMVIGASAVPFTVRTED